MDPLSAPPRPPGRARGAGLVLFAVPLLVPVMWWWDPADDPCAYLSIAKHLSEGRLACLGMPHLHYAPGYPAIIAPAFLTGERPFLLISLIHAALATLFAWGLWRWLRRFPGVPVPLLAAAVLLNAALWKVWRATISEVAFLPLLVWSALALERLASAAGRRAAAGWLALAIVLCAALTLVRQVGVLLPAAFGLREAWRALRRGTGTARALATTTPLLAASLAVVALLHFHGTHTVEAAGGDAKTYAEHFVPADGSFLGAAVEGVRLRVSACGRLLLPGFTKVYSRAGEWLHPATLAYVALFAALAAGWWAAFRASGDLLLLVGPSWLLLHVFWPFDQGTRYLVPVLPVLVLSLWAAAARLGRFRPAAFRILAAAHLVAAVVYGVRGFRSLETHDRWPAVERCRAAIATDPGRVAVRGLDHDWRNLLAFHLDRNVRDLDPAAAPPDGLRWIISPPGLPGLPAFEERLRDRDFVVLRRIDDAGAAPGGNR